MKYCFQLLFPLLGLPVSHAAFPTIELQPVAIGQFFAPTTVTNCGDARLFIADQRGKIHILSDGQILPSPFLDLGTKLVSERSGFDERGLIGLAFHPDHLTADSPGEGCFYVYYSAPSPNSPGTAQAPVNHQTVVAEFKVNATNPDIADISTERILLTFDQPQFNHDGGQLAFGPDGFLYIASGDGGSSNDNNAGHTGGSAGQPSGALGNSQDKTNLLGKVLRIDPFGNNGPGGEFGIPPTNPFASDGGGVRGEIFAYGLRNPWRFSFDDGPGGTNRLFLADVGQNKFEEINLITAGGNYGWRRFEAFENFATSTPSVGPYTDPIAAYAHPGVTSSLTKVGLSVTGGYVYRGSALPDLVGKYIFADWSTTFNGSGNGTLLGLEETTPDNFTLSVLEVSGGNPIGRYIPCLGVDNENEIYVATRTALAPSASESGTGDPSGQLFKIASDPLTRRQIWERQFYQIGEFIDPNGDEEPDSIRTLLEYGWDLSPNARDHLDDHFEVDLDAATGIVNGFFRRDPRAIDLTYIFETSTNLADWSPLVTSTLGATPTGAAFVSEAVDPAKPDTLRVDFSFTADFVTDPSAFVRLRVIRP